MANFIPDGIAYFAYFVSNFNFDKDANVAQLEAALGDGFKTTIDPPGNKDAKLRIASSNSSLAAVIYNDSFMLTNWFFATPEKTEEVHAFTKEAASRFLGADAMSQKYDKLTLSGSGYYFPDNSDNEASSKAATEAIIDKISCLERKVGVIDFSLVVSRKQTQGTDEVSYQVKQNPESGIYALYITVNKRIHSEAGMDTSQVNEHIQATDMLKILQDESKAIDELIKR